MFCIIGKILRLRENSKWLTYNIETFCGDMNPFLWHCDQVVLFLIRMYSVLIGNFSNAHKKNCKLLFFIFEYSLYVSFKVTNQNITIFEMGFTNAHTPRKDSILSILSQSEDYFMHSFTFG